MDLDKLGYLAEFIRIRNVADQSIARIIGRPAHPGHIAEFIAAEIFSVHLHPAAVHKASDGIFGSGPFEGKSVNIKYKGRIDGSLDLVESPEANNHPDTYLVLTGPRSGAVSSRGTVAPWVITDVYLFDSLPFIDELVQQGRNPGVATSVRRNLWDSASIYPEPNPALYPLSAEQHAALQLFAPVTDLI